MLYSIKDKNNLFSYTTWSMGDYGRTGIINLSNASNFYQISVEESSNGDYSFRLTETTSDNVYFGRNVEDVSDLIGKTVIFSCNILTNNPIFLSIYIHDSIQNTYSNARVSVISDNILNKFTISSVILENTDRILFRIDTNKQGTILYTDNWEVIVQ